MADFSARSFVDDFSSLSQGQFRVPSHPFRDVSDSAKLEVVLIPPQRAPSHRFPFPPRNLESAQETSKKESHVSKKIPEDGPDRNRVQSPRPLLMWNGAPMAATPTAEHNPESAALHEPPTKKKYSHESSENSKASQTATDLVKLDDGNGNVVSVGNQPSKESSSESTVDIRRRRSAIKVNYTPIGRPGTTSQFRGVTVTKPGEVWQAQIRVHGVLHALGRFDNEEDAARAYDEHALRLGRPVNFPSSGQTKALKPGSSRYRGVTLEKGSKGSAGKWKARMGISGKIVPLGNFDTEEEAALAYDEKARELGRPTNFPLNGEAR